MIFPATLTPGKAIAEAAFPKLVKWLLPRSAYRYSPLIVMLLVTAYSAPPPIVQPTWLELGLPFQKEPVVLSKAVNCELPPPPCIARPSHRTCAVSHRLCVERLLPSQIMCARNGVLLRVNAFIIARRYT